MTSGTRNIIRTKIVGTIGPSSNRPAALSGIVNAGMNVARLNFSHGDESTHLQSIKSIRRVAVGLNKTIAIMADLSGPKIRTGRLEADEADFKTGDKVILTASDIIGNNKRIGVNYPEIIKDAATGDKILLADGLIQLRVISTADDEVVCLVENEGTLKSRQGINLPGKTLNIPAITAKDRADLRFILKNNVDWIAMSFVRFADDVRELKSLIKAAGFDTPVIAKIEKSEAIENLEEIIEVADGLMLARGDLGVEIPIEQLPVVQKKVIKKAQRHGIPVITATQMLDSMIRNPRPTRAEASDVANAIFDGTDAVMLSGETAIGAYPVDSIEMMTKICRQAESALDWETLLRTRSHWALGTVSDAISYATCQLNFMLKSKAIITSTQSGRTARQVSRYRPKSPIIAVSPRREVVNRLMLSWGVVPILVDTPENIDGMFELAVDAAKRSGLALKGDKVIITAGVLVNIPGTTNLIKVHSVD